MKLKTLEIEMNRWGPYEGQYTGKIEYENEKGRVSLTLDPEVSAKVLIAIGANIHALTVGVADNFAASVQQSIAEAKSPALTA